MMYELTQEDIDTYWMAQEGGMAWMRKWLGWWCIPNGHNPDAVEWCNSIGNQLNHWGYYDDRYYFRDKHNALLFLLKFGRKEPNKEWA